MFRNRILKQYKGEKLTLTEHMLPDDFNSKFNKKFTDGDKDSSSSTTATSSSDTETETVTGSSSYEDDGTNKTEYDETNKSTTYTSTDSVSTVDNQDRSKNTVIKRNLSGSGNVSAPISLTNDAKVNQNKSNVTNQAETIRPTINKRQSVSAGGINSNILVIIILVLLLSLLIENN